MKAFLSYACIIIFLFWGCQKEENHADVIFTNGNIYTVDSLQPTASVIAVKNHRIIGVGESSIISDFKGENTKIVDLEKAFVMPGFIEGHGHFGGFGEGRRGIDQPLRAG